MFSLKLRLLAGVATALLCPTALADSGLFVEPAVTYESGKTTVTYPSPLSNSTGRSDGLGLGARVGFHINDVIFVGAEGRYSKPRFTDSALDYGANAASTNFGPVAGIQTPVAGLRVWAAYILAGDLDPDESGGVDVKFSGAKGYRIGAGFRVAIVSLNLEYQQLKYDTSTLQKLGPLTPGSTFDSVHLNSDSWIASVSFPIAL